MTDINTLADLPKLVAPHFAHRFQVNPGHMTPELGRVFTSNIQDVLLDMKTKTLTINYRQTVRPESFKAAIAAIAESRFIIDFLSGNDDGPCMSLDVEVKNCVSHKCHFDYRNGGVLMHVLTFAVSRCEPTAK